MKDRHEPLPDHRRHPLPEGRTTGFREERFAAAERIRMLFAQAGPGLAVNAVVGVALVAFLWHDVPPANALAWLVALLVTVLGRALVVRAYLRAQPSPRALRRWRAAQTSGALAAGAVWGSVPWAFGAATGFEQHVLMMLVLGGMACGGIPVLASELRTYLAFAGAMGVGVMAWLLLQQAPPYPLLAGFTALFFVAMIATARNYARSLGHALVFREANRRLSSTLVRARDREALLRDDHERLRDFAELGADVYWETDADLRLSFVSSRCEELLGLPPEALLERAADDDSQLFGDWWAEALAAMLRRARFDGVRLQVEHGDGRTVYLLASGKPVSGPDGGFRGYRGMLRDVSAQHALTERLAYQAAHDQLTGLINRREFERRLARAVASAQPARTHVLLYLDLDRFKLVNDSCGHAAGDTVLRDLAALIRARLRGRDSLGRLGGDEFAVLMEQCPLEAALVVAEALRVAVAAYRFERDGGVFTFGVSIGVLVLSDPEAGADGVLARADAACYAAKAAGRDRIEIASGAPAGVVVAGRPVRA
ncbi:MAG: diguanylate cyclase [Gammaproteobacteria bacterium]